MSNRYYQEVRIQKIEMTMDRVSSQRRRKGIPSPVVGSAFLKTGGAFHNLKVKSDERRLYQQNKERKSRDIKPGLNKDLQNVQSPDGPITPSSQ